MILPTQQLSTSDSKQLDFAAAEVVEHPGGGFTVAVPLVESPWVRRYFGQLDTEEQADSFCEKFVYVMEVFA